MCNSLEKDRDKITKCQILDCTLHRLKFETLQRIKKERKNIKSKTQKREQSGGEKEK